MIIQYNVVVTIVNLIDNSTSKFNKTFNAEIKTATDALLYNNYHVLSKNVYILDMFEDEVDAYCKAKGIEKSSVEIEEFEIVSLTDRTDVFFETEDESLSLKPTIKCYVYPKNDALKIPELTGVAYDSTTIIWSWPNDEEYAHYLIEEAIDPNSEADKSKIIAQLPIGATSYTETGLTPDTAYTRRLINYTDEQTSTPSASVTVTTETVEVSESLESYTVPKNYDFTIDDSEKEILKEKLTAFHSGVGDGNDLKIYKQMDADFYQKFKSYFEITGRRTEKEKRYDQVGFNYKVCLEAEETVEEQEGEVTFDVNAYPREWIAVEDYAWATHPVEVKTRLTATVFLRKEVGPEESDKITISVKKPNIEKVPVTTMFSKKTAIIISIDESSSMRQKVNGKARYVTVREAVAGTYGLINKIDDLAKASGVKDDELIQYIIVGWAGTNDQAKVYYNGYSAQEAKAKVNEKISYYTDGYTNWYKGLTKGLDSIAADREAIGQIFFTDGFVNMDKDCNIAYKESDYYADSVKGSIQEAKERLVAKKCNTYFIFGNGAYHVDTDYPNKYLDDARAFAKNIIVPEVQEVFGNNCYYPGYNSSVDNMSEETLAANLIKGLSVFNEVVTGYTEKFTGWDTNASTTTEVNSYSIDHVKAITITTDVYSYTFDNNKTPVKYSRSEKRAIIPEANFLSMTKLSETSLYDIIINEVKKTSEWNIGYNKTIGTIESGGESDKFLISGLSIKDTYRFADEDEITEDNWNTLPLKNGMEGTVNTFANIDKVNETTYSDDCYLVSKDSYLQIQGYTDAIIYDSTRFVRTELNAYDHPSEIIISATDIYNDSLRNRKKKSLKYSDVSTNKSISHVIDIIEKDKDIWLEGYSTLTNVGDWVKISPLEDDLIAHNDIMYSSPILNYRFNLEDPDAKTPLCEILPECDPNSNYLNLVILHVYYAKNVFITNENNYVNQFGSEPEATTSSEYIPLTEDLYKFTKKEWKDNTDNGWYIDNYIWFMAKPMNKRQKYYDELPGIGIDSFYGMVNGRYRIDNQNGKQDLRVDTPQFNIPTTVHEDTIKIYIVITESHPKSALVSYKWDNPLNSKDNITQVNGDYVTFSSDNLVYKDVDYYDVISTINMENQEIFDNKTVETMFEITKPNTVKDYKNYYLEVSTDNSDVLALRYPTEITFNENDISNVGIAFKGVVNATSQWAPRIHNGYYYLNQHEYFAYSEFDVEANFDTYEEANYKTANGYITFDVQLRRKAKPKENYSIAKNTRSELLQNEDEFQWVDNKGLTLKPFIDGKYYKKYLAYEYISPVILFDNALTETGTLKVNYSFEDGSDFLPLEVRSYDVEQNKWSDWVEFTNNTAPNVPLSSGYQIKAILQPSIQENEITLEDYMCCYLDWKDDMSENTENIVTVTDHMTTGPEEGQGVYVSKVIDYGCETELMLDMFESYYKHHAQIYLSYSSVNEDSLLIENISWQNITNSKDEAFKGRYFRYKIVVPEGEKVYWLRKRIKTLKTDATLPYITGISMTGSYSPSDIVTNFINTESFEVLKDGKYHVVFDRVIDVIGADVLEKGFTEQEIEYVKIKCTTEDIELQYNNGLDNQYPQDYLNYPIGAKSNVDMSVTIKNTPYIFVEKDDFDKYNVIKIKGTPQQYCPITVEDTEGNSYIQLHNATSFLQEETFLLTEKTKYLELKTNRYDNNLSVYKDGKKLNSNEVNYEVHLNNNQLNIENDEFQVYVNDNKLDLMNFKVYIDNEELKSSHYKVVNHLIIFDEPIDIGHTIKVEYCIKRSFIANIDRQKNTTTIYLYSGKDIPMPEKCKVYFETGTRNNKFIAEELSLNPIYRTDYKGFIYLTDEHNEPYEVKIYCNPLRLKAGGYDKVDVLIEVLDINGNPVVSKNVAVDCSYGILNYENYDTDINGVVHLVYESAYMKCTDKLTAKVLTDDGTLIEQSIDIINE